jgi:hypothetical protein
MLISRSLFRKTAGAQRLCFPYNPLLGNTGQCAGNFLIPGLCIIATAAGIRLPVSPKRAIGENKNIHSASLKSSSSILPILAHFRIILLKRP